MTDEEETFPVQLTHDGAWLLANAISPGPSVPELDALRIVRIGRDLRMKVNSTILRFQDEVPPPATVEIPFTSDEAWLVDQAIRYDGPGGLSANILVQLYRGIWSLHYGLPYGKVEDPYYVFDKTLLPKKPRARRKKVLDASS